MQCSTAEPQVNAKIGMTSEGSHETEDWSNDNITLNNNIFNYIQRENLFKLLYKLQ